MISIISSTNRVGSYSLKVAHYYKGLIDSKGVASQVIDLSTLPQDFAFSALYDNQGKSKGFNEVIKMVNASEKFVFIVPEYNGSFPGVLKTVIDGLEYPAGLKNKKAALLGISSGTQGGSLALSHFTDILNYLNVYVLPSKPRIAKVEQLFQDGIIKDKFLTDLINKQADDLIKF